MTQEILLIFIGAIVTAFIGGIINEACFKRKSILPLKFRSTKDDYQKLMKIKYEHRLVADPENPNEAAWARSKISLIVKKKNLIEGEHTRFVEKSSAIKYKVVGEIRERQMILTETCRDDPKEFFTAIYPGVLNTEQISGLVIGTEKHGFMSAFTVLSSTFLKTKKLNKLLYEHPYSQLVELQKEVEKEPYFVSIFERGES